MGEIYFVDLAGSEMSQDSMHHDAERRKECKYINTSLMTLKECLHVRASSASHQSSSNDLKKSTQKNLSNRTEDFTFSTGSNDFHKVFHT